MAQTLGEKLREAREGRGISLSEVAEQTRISPYYIEAIERDDYKPLPGGIFNKGFVKSFAKYVGVDENEALNDYLKVIANTEKSAKDDEPVFHRPTVMTDDTSARSTFATILGAVLMLGAMTALVLFGLNYLSERGDSTPTANGNVSTNEPQQPAADSASASATPDTLAAAPTLAGSKFELVTTQPVSVTATMDGTAETRVISPSSPATFQPQQSLKISYSKSLSSAITLAVNARAITLPAQPLDPKRSVIEFEINKDNFEAIWASSRIEGSAPGDASQPAADTTPNAPSNVRTTTNSAASPADAGQRATPTRRPTATATPAASPTRPTPRATPNLRPTTIIVPSATRRPN